MLQMVSKGDGRRTWEEEWRRVKGVKEEWCDTDRSQSFTTVAAGTKGTLICPVSRAHQASHNICEIFV